MDYLGLGPDDAYDDYDASIAVAQMFVGHDYLAE
jgi:hypothetical protein